MKKVLFSVVVVLLLVAFGVSAFMVGSYILEGKKQADRTEQLSDIVANAQATTEATDNTPSSEATTEAPATEITETTEVPEPTMIPGYEELYKLNPDTAGWIKIEGTKVDYPVMCTPNDPNYYLYRDFDGNQSDHGSIYAWGDVNEPSDNIVIFGHNMKDGSMFASLGNYVNDYYWQDHSLIFFDTLNEYHTYKIFAVFKTSMNLEHPTYYPYHKFENADSKEEFNDYVNTVKSMSFYDTGITPQYGDKLIALSVCEYTLDNGRLVVCGVRIA